MRIIGLTGGIASGKSTISDILRSLGAEVVDVDLVGREVVRQGCPAYNKIIESFGSSILRADGEINRKKLGNIIFSDAKKLQLLNQITHPAIIDRVNSRVEACHQQNKKAVVIDAAILIEMGLHRYVDSVWLVMVDRETQLQRVMERDRLSEKDARNRINAQMTNEERKAYADVVIDNSQPVDAVRDVVKELWTNI
jgi:dephospho-CoA kinase